MNELYDIWFTKDELLKIDKALHHLKDKDPFNFDFEAIMLKLDHLIERSK
jgi:hypothetical protein